MTILENWLSNSLQFSLEILKILPPVLILMALLDAWVPRAVIESQLGKNSGVKGKILSIFLGTAAAGPLFAAFPIALSLKKKGISLSNLVIFLGSWSTIKIPMLVMESNFLGWDFTLLRFAITLPLILLIGILMEKFAPENELCNH